MIATSKHATVGLVFKNGLLFAAAPYAYKLLGKERRLKEVVEILKRKGFKITETNV